MASIAEVRLRREKVKKLLFRGHRSQLQIAVELKVSPRTIASDVKAVLPEIEKEIDKMEKEVRPILRDFFKQTEGLLDAAWSAHDRADNSNARIGALRVIHDLLFNKVKMLQSLGKIREVAAAQREPMEIVLKYKHPYAEVEKSGDKTRVRTVGPAKKVSRKPK